MTSFYYTSESYRIDIISYVFELKILEQTNKVELRISYLIITSMLFHTICSPQIPHLTSRFGASSDSCFGRIRDPAPVPRGSAAASSIGVAHRLSGLWIRASFTILRYHVEPSSCISAFFLQLNLPSETLSSRKCGQNIFQARKHILLLACECLFAHTDSGVGMLCDECCTYVCHSGALTSSRFLRSKFESKHLRKPKAPCRDDPAPIACLWSYLPRESQQAIFVALPVQAESCFHYWRYWQHRNDPESLEQ